MTTDDVLRRDLIELSRRRALSDRNRLSHHSPIPLAVGLAAGVLLAWAIFGRRRGLASAALLVLGGACLAAFRPRVFTSQELFADRQPRTGSREADGSRLDESGCESFPASDPPAQSQPA